MGRRGLGLALALALTLAIAAVVSLLVAAVARHPREGNNAAVSAWFPVARVFTFTGGRNPPRRRQLQSSRSGGVILIVGITVTLCCVVFFLIPRIEGKKTEAGDGAADPRGRQQMDGARRQASQP